MSPRGAAFLIRWWPFAAVAAIWLVVATRQIALPGLYMDAVNPDYLVVRVLNPQAESIDTQVLPGNYLFGRAPLLVSLYHGSQQFWLGLPLFALFGTTVTGLRLTHAVFALGVLAAMYAMLARGNVRPWQAALACAALALDPAFSYAFRTQSYITLAPTAWLFVALYFLQRASAADSKQRRWIVVSGAFYGLAVVGYFIYAFYLPAMLLAVVLWSRSSASAATDGRLRRWVVFWLGGLALGAAFYPIGYALMIRAAGSVYGAWGLFQQMQQALSAFSAQASLADRFAHLATMIGAVFSNWFHHMLIFNEYAPLPGSWLKTFLLVAAPAGVWLLAEMRRQAPVPLRVMIALPVSFLLVALLFGTRLQGHHFVPLLPLAYAALTLALCASGSGRRGHPREMRSAFGFAVAVLIALNVVGQMREGDRLAETRGVGLFSDAINRLGDDLAAMDPKPYLYFPDWGLSMPVALLTRGAVGMERGENLDRARRLLCQGRDVAFAAISGDRTARIEAWRRDLRWVAPVVVPYRQGDGKVVFDLATFKGVRAAPGCAAQD